MRYYSVQFADNYSAGTYGGCTYNATGACTTTGGTGTSSSTGLVNTGFVVAVIATVACALICAAIVVRYWRRTRKLAAEPIALEDDAEVIDARTGR